MFIQKLRPTVFSGAYSQLGVYRIAAQDTWLVLRQNKAWMAPTQWYPASIFFMIALIGLHLGPNPLQLSSTDAATMQP